jgi:peptidyl-prolyl cis-trans isomerase A (cyclophilin A)
MKDMKKGRRTAGRFAVLVFCSGLAVVPAGQTQAGAVAGRVRDSSGAVLPGVAVSLGGQPLKAPQTVQTGLDGTYRFADVPDGAYTLSFRLTAFAPLNRADIVVAGAPVTADVTLSLQGTHKEVPTPEGARVRIQTSHGDIDLVVDTKRAPITAANFLKYVDAGFYDGGRFHRATRPDNYNTAPPNRPMMELIQGGINPANKGKGFPAIPLERTSVTGLKHVRGTVSMARGGPDTATSDFFILLDDQPSLDFGGMRFDDHQGAAAFGVVVSGLNVVAIIQQQPVKGQNLAPPVTIQTIRRIA